MCLLKTCGWTVDVTLLQSLPVDQGRIPGGDASLYELILFKKKKNMDSEEGKVQVPGNRDARSRTTIGRFLNTPASLSFPNENPADGDKGHVIPFDI